MKKVITILALIPTLCFGQWNSQGGVEAFPYLKTCEAFSSQYKGDYRKNYDDFIATIELFNSVCP